MELTKRLWIHSASFTYRLDEPEKLFETIWAPRPGWGYILRRDLWIESSRSQEELVSNGYVPRESLDHETVKVCISCGMYICSVPGSLLNKHLAQCAGGSEGKRKIEEFVLDEHRMKRFEALMKAQKLREKQEEEAAEKRDKFERIKDEILARQQAKDRKKRLKQETKDQIKEH